MMENLNEVSLGAGRHVKKLTHLPQRPPVNIEFQDLTYSVPVGRKSSKIILRSISGHFRSGQLTAILGPSGAGKSTLLNILAGYKCFSATGQITTNGLPRDMRQFRKLSRYIMQEDLLQPRITVQESMMIAADLKLGSELSKEKKKVVISEILEMLRLGKVKDTTTSRLSGGERKRLSIALELVNNPPVIFLDEPTTGLDDLSSSQCIALLKQIAEGGRTVICSVHTPSARLFSMFDHVYIVAAGQCVYQGFGGHIVKFLQGIDLACPLHYNPADFVIEVSSGEYGDHLEKMVAAVDNGRLERWEPPFAYDVEEQSSNANQSISDPTLAVSILQLEPEPVTNHTRQYHTHQYKYKSSAWDQFKVLLYRMMLQHWRNSAYFWLKVSLHIFLGIIIGFLFLQMGEDGSKTIFNFGFCYACLVVLLYVPMLPVLLSFPSEVQLLKREYFNRWYGLKPYFAAATLSRMPIQVVMSSIYLIMTYLITGQPLELSRFSMFFSILVLVALISETLGVIISSTLNVVNSVFTGPAFSVPLMLLAVYGIGSGDLPVPLHWRLAMYCSYLRYGIEGLVVAMYGVGRQDLQCPDDEIYCEYKSPKYFVRMMGMKDASFSYDLSMLVLFLLAFNACGYYLLRQRLSPNRTFKALKYIGKFVKSHMNMTSH